MKLQDNYLFVHKKDSIVIQNNVDKDGSTIWTQTKRNQYGKRVKIFYY